MFLTKTKSDEKDVGEVVRWISRSDETKKTCGEKEGRKLTTTTKIMANFLQIYLSIQHTRIFPLTLSLIAWRSGLRADLPCRRSRYDSRLRSFFFVDNVFSFCFYLLFCFVFLFLWYHIVPFWLVYLFSYCWLITSSRGFCDKHIEF